jgi:hypothetical protein
MAGHEIGIRGISRVVTRRQVALRMFAMLLIVDLIGGAWLYLQIGHASRAFWLTFATTSAALLLAGGLAILSGPNRRTRIVPRSLQVPAVQPAVHQRSGASLATSSQTDARSRSAGNADLSRVPCAHAGTLHAAPDQKR